jgi:hypothetical protein
MQNALPQQQLIKLYEKKAKKKLKLLRIINFTFAIHK